MRYFVTLDSSPDAKPVAIDVSELPSGALEVSIGARRIDVDIVALPTALSVRVEGRVVDLVTEGHLPELGAIAAGQRTYVRVENERTRLASAVRKGPSAGAEKVVKSPMPGRVVRLLIAKGDTVEAGQTLCVVEAMKMENEVKAKTAATVQDVHVREGATVEGNAKLITFA